MMLRIVAAPLAACCAVIWSVCAPEAAAQGWNDARTAALVARATARRAQQLADTALIDYKADAHGYVTFLAQVGQGFPEPPKIVKADELVLQVYWRAPNLSKQIIQGRRDTLLLPTDIQYHRDHLAIVQNNFPNVIRVGEGDEVRDVPHPLSAAGLRMYDFHISDSLRYRLPDRTIEVYEVKVKPKDDRSAGVIGAVYIDTAGAQVVRMAFSFTRAALLDASLEDVSIVLENGLIEGRFWLPRHQEVEIRRTGTWMDYPVRGIIRGRWEISQYQINVHFSPALFAGDEIVQLPPAQQKLYPWPYPRILDSLPPDVRAVTDEDVQRVQAEARSLVRKQALQRTQSSVLAARGLSQLVHFNRVEGVAVGLGATQRLGAGVSITGRAGYGLADHDWKGQLSLAWQSATGTQARVFSGRDLRDVGDVQERSGAANSLAAQEFGSDYVDPYEATALGGQLQLRKVGGIDWNIRGAAEKPRTLAVHAAPVVNRFLPTVAVDERRSLRFSVSAEHPTALALLGTELRWTAELREATPLDPGTCAVTIGPPPLQQVGSACVGSYQTLRAFLMADVERPFGAQRFVARSFAGAVSARNDLFPSQELVYFGGPVTAPGYEFHEFVSRAAVSQRVEWQTPIPFPSISLGRFGRSPRDATLAPFANLLFTRPFEQDVRGGGAPLSPHVTGVYPSAGVGLLTLFDLLRVDVARGIRRGRWTLSVDVNSEFWSIL